MKNKQKNGKKSYLYIIFLALAFVILLGTGAYAYYQTTITGTITGSVAQWSFKANNQTSTFNIDFGSLYPGKSADYAIELSAEDSELPVIFELIFHWPEIDDADTINDFVLSQKIDALNGKTSLINPLTTEESDSWRDYNTNVIPGLKGIIMPGDKVTIPLYYRWGYGGSGTDYQDYFDAMGEALTMPITIIGRQVDKSNVEGFYNSVIFSDLLGLNSECTNGTYAYPNKYGFPCEFLSLVFDLEVEPIFVSNETIDFTLDDGAIEEEFPTYMVWPIKPSIK